MKLIISLIFIFNIFNSLKADEMQKLSREYGLYAGTKATLQWERVFSSQRRLEKYNLHKLDDSTKQKLKRYLINHAADSDQPIVPGL